jgi:hypothetical protein
MICRRVSIGSDGIERENDGEPFDALHLHKAVQKDKKRSEPARTQVRTVSLGNMEKYRVARYWAKRRGLIKKEKLYVR